MTATSRSVPRLPGSPRPALARVAGRIVLVVCLFQSLHAACGPGKPIGDAQPPSEPLPKPEVIREFWPDGKPKLQKEVVRLHDDSVVNHGLYTRWFDNGNKEYESTYKDGRLNGIETAWHRNGVKWTEGHYEKGLRHGPHIAWDEEGRKRKEENYWEDKPHGTWIIWDKDGKVKWQAQFEHGDPAS